MEYYSAVKKKNLPFVIIWMDLENIMLSEISQSQKDKYQMEFFKNRTIIGAVCIYILNLL